MKKIRKFAQLVFAIAPTVVFGNSTHAFSKEPIPAVPAATVNTSRSFAGFSASNATALDVALRGKGIFASSGR
jgi:hypothetical protein